MTVIHLPVLDGRTPLGFLAALGLTRLLDAHTDDAPKLSWSPRSLTASLHTSRASVDAVVDDLRCVIASIPDGGVLPGVPVNLPPLGEAPDGLRLPPAELREYVSQLSADPNPQIEAWVCSLVTDLSVDRNSRADISLMTAPSGRQSMRTMLQKPLQHVREDPACLIEALTGWRRRPGVSGEYLDHRVLFDAADSGSGASQERGVPGATWLALMAYPLLRTTAHGGEPVTTGWQRRPHQPSQFIYPLWQAPLDTHAIAALLEHPLMLRCATAELPEAMHALSVFAVQRAQRRKIPGRTFAGVLGPVQ